MQSAKEIEAMQNKFHAELEKFKIAQKKSEKLVRLNSQLETQLHENEMVKEELGFCKEDARVFKLVGDVLVPQSLTEARSNVVRRIEYIQNESKRNTELINTNKTELVGLRDSVTALEQELQKTQQASKVQ
ncbi:prefoldin subunit 6 isoform X1 [Folsomia candida]|uniref:prefoldin subunit 6 isoform X1 n=1 Tax=Folsomia candida TaxID=158441 RepID=UPI000B8FD20B|nr:prefoldin subunit 6 isoform X1 [Folsomia candida]